MIVGRLSPELSTLGPTYHLRTTGVLLASDYCWGKEVARAIERHKSGEATVVPVILRSCDWENTPFAKFQGLPEDMKPIKTWPDRDVAWTNVARGIRTLARATAK